MADDSNGHGAVEELSTVFVGGLPLDSSHRELDNLCRFMPGFVSSKVDMRKGTTLFVLFDSNENAKAAIALLHNQDFDRANPAEPLRAQLARSNMKNSGPAMHGSRSGGDVFRPAHYAWQPPPPVQPHPVVGHAHGGLPHSIGDYSQTLATGGGNSRSRASEDASQVDTVAVVGGIEKGFDASTLEIMFSSLPGFVAFKENAKMGGGFAKYITHAHAQQAIASMQQEGVPAALARSSMTAPVPQASDHGFDGGGRMQPAMPVYGLSYGATTQQWPIGGPRGAYAVKSGMGSTEMASKRQRTPEHPGSVDTIACVGALEAGFDERSLQDFFGGLHGFVAFKPNPRMGGGFAKFSSAELANEACRVAQEQGIPASLARSSMTSVN